MNIPVNKRILVIDDNPAIHGDFLKILVKNESSAKHAEAEAALFGEVATSAPIANVADFVLDFAFQGQEGLAKVEAAIAQARPYAMAFVDVRMPPGWDGIETIQRIWQIYPELQVVICTAYSDYSWDEMFTRVGQSDRLVILKKPFDNVEVLQLAHALTKKWSLTLQVQAQVKYLDELVNQRTAELQAAVVDLKHEAAGRHQVQDALNLSEERFAKAFKASPIAQAIVNERHELYLDFNDSFLNLTGYTRDELACRPFFDSPIWKLPETRNHLKRLIHETRAARDLECQILTKTGQRRAAVLFGEPVLLGDESCVLLMVQDVSDRRTLEGQLRQSQKMEAVGQLAAGVAHDFNNLLTVIQGHAQLVLSRGKCDAPTKTSLDHITGASQRASLLTRQLLTFSRKQPLQLRALDFNSAVKDATAMLGRILGENIAVQINSDASSPSIQGDSGMLDQIIVNLAVNARDAMPKGGKLVFTTRRVQIDAAFARFRPETRAGSFVCLEVADSGCGMDAATLERIFEPFFTTKPAGQGTGLGLATVYAIAKQHQGWIDVASELGVGTTFKVFLPLSTQSPAEEDSYQTTTIRRGRSETILVVEDEPLVREFVSEVLRDIGYKVLVAEHGKQALSMWQEYKDRIDLLLTDLVMPEGVSGWELADQLKALNPDLKVVFTSGYSPDILTHNQQLHENQNFLPKPFQLRTLARTVNASLSS